MVRLLCLLVIVATILAGVMLLRHSTETHKLIPGQGKEIHVSKFESWQQFRSAIGNFTVYLPSYPQHSQESVPIPNTKLALEYNLYVVEDEDGTTYMVSLVDYPEGVDTSNEEAILENVMNEMMGSNPSNKLRSLEFGTFRNKKSLTFEIASNEVLISSVGFLVDKKLYLITMIDNKAKFEAEEHSYFLNSFHFIEE